MIVLTLTFGMFVTYPAISQDFQRGMKNYQEIIQGKKTFEQLSPQEQQEVIIVNQYINKQKYKDNESADCNDAISRAKRAATELADYTRRLRGCAEANDYSDDCSSEYRHVKNAYNDYESAVSSVRSYCR